MPLEIDRMLGNLAPLARARARAEAEGAAQAVPDYFAAGDQFLQSGNLFAATAVFDEALRALASTNLAAEKRALSERLDAASTVAAFDEETPAAQRTLAAFEHAARFWSETERPFHGQRALCFACSALKASAWLRCEACSVLPQAPRDVAFSLLLSERVCSFERLNQLVHRDILEFAQRASRFFERDLANVLAPPLMVVRDIAPGLLYSALDETRRTAVLIEVVTGTDLVAAKPAVLEFVKEFAARLLEGRGASDHVPELKELRHRFGTHIDLGRVERLSVTNGASAVSSLSVTSSRGPRLARHLGVQTCSAVALEATSGRKPAMLEDLAQTLAGQLLVLDRESRLASDTARVDIRDDLLTRPFLGDPSISVRDAIAVLGIARGESLSLSAAARLQRPYLDSPDPDGFPAKQALRASRRA